MSWLLTITLVALVALVALVFVTPARAFVAQAIDRLRQRVAPRRPRPSTGVTVIAADGQEYEVPAERQRWPSLATRVETLGGTRRLVAGTLVALLAILAIVQLYQLLLAPQPEQFVVLVAPFHDPNGTVGATGREVAATLAGELSRRGGLLVARTVDTPPADAAAALQTLDREGADALIWGAVTPGGMLDRESITPLLVYRPTGPFAPYGWEGYAGRFAIPSAYALSTAPINGKVVLPPLLSAMADYGAGRVDPAFATLGQILDQYPAVAPALPRVLRGNVLWARGEYRDAADEYRRAIGSLAQPTGAQAAMLYNNLGAILQDAGDAQSTTAFNQAIDALNGSDLSALRYNLAIQALRIGKYDDASAALEIARARDLFPAATPAAPLLLTLADTYRLAGRFAEARSVLDTAAQQSPLSAVATTADLQYLVRTRFDSAVETERALLNLAEASGARGPLPWEAESSRPLPIRVLNDAERDLKQAVDETQVLTQRWSRLAVSRDAASEQAAGQIATRHALLAQELLRDRRRWLAGVDIEIERAQGIQEPRGLGAVWAALVGDRSPLGRARTTLDQLVQSQPTDVDSLVLLGRSYLLTGDYDKAGEYYGRAASAARQRPEPVYGQALVALKNNQTNEDRAAARPLLQRAIDLNPAFFPAREKLAAVAEQDSDWATAIAQRRWLLANRPSSERRELTLTLAETLRKSGRSGFAEAERLLLPYANQNDTTALLALSRLYVDQGDLQAARDVLVRAEQSAPRDPEPAYQLAQLLERSGNTAGAEAEYQRAIGISTSHIPSRLGLGALYAGEGKLAQAGEQYRAALAAGAQDPDALRQIGVVLLANREYERAAEAFSRALSSTQAQNDAETHHGLAQAQLGLNKLAEAEQEEQRAIELRGGTFPEAEVGLGDIARLRAQYDQAVQHYDAALSQSPKLVGAHLGLGRVAAAQGNWSVAEARFRDAITIEPNLADAHLARGEALLQIQQPRDAIAEYARAAELKPTYPEAYLGLAKAQLAAGQGDLAQANLDQALKLRPAYPEALLFQGIVDEQKGDSRAAIDAYGQAIAAGGKLAEPYYRRALLYISAERVDDAAGDLEKAIGIQENFPEAHYWLGRAYLAQGRPRQARDQLALATEQRGGDYPDALFYQGLAEEQLGQRTEALASYQAALAQNSGGEWAGQARSALDRLRQP